VPVNDKYSCQSGATLAVRDAALAAAETALRSGHPTVDDIPFHPERDVVPPLLTAHLVLARAAEPQASLVRDLRRREHVTSLASWQRGRLARRRKSRPGRPIS